MKLRIAVAAFLPLIGCGVDRGSGEAVRQSVAVTESVSRETFSLGTAVTPSGAVPKGAAGETFTRGGEVFLSVNVSRASTDQLVAVEWLGPSGEVLHRDERRAPQGTQYVSFSSGGMEEWPPGAHRAVVVIDGRRVSEKAFMVL